MSANSPAPELACREYAFGSADYRAAVYLREAVLRQPLGLTLTPADFAGEDTSFHLGCFAEGKLVGTLILFPLDARVLKMRQVAVAPQWQGRGVGTKLVAFAESFAAARGFTTIIAHARGTARSFYRKLGYREEGELFPEQGIPHIAIRKNLSPL
jgi:ribosomal protein S18 acetylase RimI-like enzyme